MVSFVFVHLVQVEMDCVDHAWDGGFPASFLDFERANV